MRSACILAIAVACRLAGAEPQREAQDHLERGKHLYEAQDYDGAIAEYQAGYLLEQRAEFLYGIGQAYRMKGDCERAIRSYDEVLHATDGAPLAEAARKNIERCHPTPAQPPPPPPPPSNGSVLARRSPARDAAWYRDAIGDALAIGGVALAGGGALAWKIGRDQANDTYGTTSYAAWSASARAASHADLLQQAGVAAVAVGGAALLGGVIRFAWPNSHADALVTPTSAVAGFGFAF